MILTTEGLGHPQLGAELANFSEVFTGERCGGRLYRMRIAMCLTLYTVRSKMNVALQPVACRYSAVKHWKLNAHRPLCDGAFARICKRGCNTKSCMRQGTRHARRELHYTAGAIRLPGTPDVPVCLRISHSLSHCSRSLSDINPHSHGILRAPHPEHL